MEEDHKLSVSKYIYEKLIELKDFLNTDLKRLAEFAFEELFQLVRDEPDTFLEIFGQFDRLRKIIDASS